MTVGDIRALAAAAPANEDQTQVDWDGFEEGLGATGFTPNSALAASWCKFGKVNIEALVDSATLAAVFSDGIYASTGKRKMFGKSVKYDAISFAQARRYGPGEYTDERGFGKFGIEFSGPGGCSDARTGHGRPSVFGTLERRLWRWRKNATASSE